MSFLIDENLSYRLKHLLKDDFPGAKHVGDYGLLTAPDQAILSCALTEGLVLLSKDDDFRELVERAGAPAKLVFLQLGNARTQAIAAVLCSRKAEIDEFLRSEAAVLTLEATR